MDSSKYIFTLDLRTIQSQITLPVTQGDTNRTLIISFSDGAKPYVLGEKATAMLSILRPTGTPVQEYCEVEKDGSCATYNFSEYTVAVAGLHKCQLVLYNAEGKQIASPKFSIDAAPKLVTGDDVVIPDDEVIALDAIYTAEAKRASAEMSRAEAEAQRVSAEAARKEASEKAINDLNTVKSSIEQMRDNGEFDGKDGKDGKDGEKGATGETGAQGPQGVQGIQGPPGPQGETGATGPQGPKGDGFSIEKTYSSISAMNAGFATDGVSLNALVLINTGNVDDVDNAKLFIKLEGGYSYLTDLSGAQGIKGDKGDKGDQGPQGPQGNQGPQGVQGNPGQSGAAGVGISKIEKTSTSGNVDTYTITLTNGAIHYFTVTNGTDGDDGTSVTVTKVVESTEDGGVNVITLSNGQTINIKNGSKGTAGSPGAQGAAGKDGKTPYIQDGYWYIDGVNTNVQAQGDNGASVTVSNVSESTESGGTNVVTFSNGKALGVKNGKDGEDGYTPVKGVDYFTQAEKDEIVAATSQIGTPKIVSSIDEMTDPDKHYILNGYIYSCRTVEVPGGTERVNEFTPTDDLINKRMSGSTGSLSTSNGNFVTDFIDVSAFITNPSVIVRLNKESTLGGDAKAVYFNSAKSRLGGNIFTTSNTRIENGETITDLKIQGGSTSSLPTDWSQVKYVRLQYTVSSSALTVSSLSGYEVSFDDKDEVSAPTTKTEFVNSNIPYTPTVDNEAINKNTEDIAELKQTIEKLENSQSGAVWYALGDSITAGYLVGADKSWVSYVMKYNGYDATKSKNLGVSGMGFVRPDPTNGKIARNIVDANDFSAVDLVTISLGINDWKESCSIDTVKTEMAYCFEKILADNPYCKIFLITPIDKKIGTEANHFSSLNYVVNGMTLEQFVETQMSVCKENGIEAIDMTHNSVVNRGNITRVFVDNTHPNEECHKALGRELARKITFA